MFRSCILMPPSRTRETCQRNNIVPLLVGEKLQHIDMSCMSHSAYPYAIYDLAYLIDEYMSIIK